MHQKKNECFSISLKKVNEAFGIGRISAKKPDERKEGWNDVEALKTKVPKEYHDLLDVFSTSEANKLPPYRPYDHQINLEGEVQPGYCPLYRMPTEELETVKQYLEDNLKKGFIKASLSPFASPVLFVKKADGSLRFCVNYRKFNVLTKKDRYPLPLIDETLAQLF